MTTKVTIDVIDTAAQQAMNPLAHGLLHVRHEKTSGDASDSIAAGSWVTRPLNAVRTNRIAGASLAFNQITLTAGRYFIRAAASNYNVDTTRLRLRDVTGSADLVLGLNCFAQDNTGTAAIALLEGEFTLSATSTLELQNRTSISGSMGIASSWATEVYADVLIWKLA